MINCFNKIMFKFYLKSGCVKNKNSKGFSLIEILIALFVFSILVTTVSGVYVGFLSSQIKAREIQRSLESAQAVLNNLSKTFRTSKIVLPASSSTVTAVRIFDYSKSSLEDACIEYSVTDEKLTVKSANLVEAACTGTVDLGDEVSLIEGRVFGGFLVDLNNSTEVGKITIPLKICPQGSVDSYCSATSGNAVSIQTTVSLRAN